MKELYSAGLAVKGKHASTDVKLDIQIKKKHGKTKPSVNYESTLIQL